jgi:hypothetical protein
MNPDDYLSPGEFQRWHTTAFTLANALVPTGALEISINHTARPVPDDPQMIESIYRAEVRVFPDLKDTTSTIFAYDFGHSEFDASGHLISQLVDMAVKAGLLPQDKMDDFKVKITKAADDGDQEAIVEAAKDLQEMIDALDKTPKA